MVLVQYCRESRDIRSTGTVLVLIVTLYSYSYSYLACNDDICDDELYYRSTRINSAGALLAFRKRFEAFPQYMRRPSVTRTSSR